MMCITAKTGRSLTLLWRSAVTTLPSYLLRVKSTIIFCLPLINKGTEERGRPELLHLPQSPLRSGSPQSPVRSGSPQSPVREPTESAPVREPTESAPVREPTESAPVREPTESAPVREPTESAPVREPTESAPVREPTESAPASQSSSVPTPAYELADSTVVTHESTKSSEAVRLTVASG